MRADSTLPLLRLHGGSVPESVIGGVSAMIEQVDQSVQAYEWTTNIATAAALVAGASLASLFDHGLHVDLARCKMIGGPRMADLAHQLRMLSSVLLSFAFAFEICVVFAATVTGTMLLSGGQRLIHPFDPVAKSATHLLHREMEFEYILIRAGFFQGLVNCAQDPRSKSRHTRTHLFYAFALLSCFQGS